MKMINDNFENWLDKVRTEIYYETKNLTQNEKNKHDKRESLLLAKKYGYTLVSSKTPIMTTTNLI